MRCKPCKTKPFTYAVLCVIIFYEDKCQRHNYAISNFDLGVAWLGRCVILAHTHTNTVLHWKRPRLTSSTNKWLFSEIKYDYLKFNKHGVAWLGRMSTDSLWMGISSAWSSNVYANNSRVAEFQRCISLTHTHNMITFTTLLFISKMPQTGHRITVLLWSEGNAGCDGFMQKVTFKNHLTWDRSVPDWILMNLLSEIKVQHNRCAFYSVSHTLLVSDDTIISRSGRRDEYIHGNSRNGWKTTADE